MRSETTRASLQRRGSMLSPLSRSSAVQGRTPAQKYATIAMRTAHMSPPYFAWHTIRIRRCSPSITGTIGKSDILDTVTYSQADGSATTGVRFRIHSLKIGNTVVNDVIGSAGPPKGSLLLGQSFLRKFRGWSVDNTQHRLVLQQ